MRGPSSRILINSIDVYSIIKTGDALDADASFDAGRAYADDPVWSGVPCQVNPDYVIIEEMSQSRTTEVREYLILFGHADLAARGVTIGERDKLVWTDGGLTLYANGPIDAAGRHAVVELKATERN